MSAKLYLTHRSRYRIRTTTGRELGAVWDDTARRFEVPTGTGTKHVTTDTVGAVALWANNGMRTYTWYPLDRVYRDATRPGVAKWSHPYRHSA